MKLGSYPVGWPGSPPAEGTAKRGPPTACGPNGAEYAVLTPGPTPSHWRTSDAHVATNEARAKPLGCATNSPRPG